MPERNLDSELLRGQDRIDLLGRPRTDPSQQIMRDLSRP
jgi:hypothetical protein